tara:strand:- start:8936 stop:9433 length:498 start_codon:yes stop_codon:yes gene_type:complete
MKSYFNIPSDRAAYTLAIATLHKLHRGPEIGVRKHRKCESIETREKAQTSVLNLVPIKGRNDGHPSHPDRLLLLARELASHVRQRLPAREKELGTLEWEEACLSANLATDGGDLDEVVYVEGLSGPGAGTIDGQCFEPVEHLDGETVEEEVKYEVAELPWQAEKG